MTETTITEHVERLQKKYGCCKVCAGMYELGRHDEKTEEKSSEQKALANICGMELHEYQKITGTNLYILRVPGGWIYSDSAGMCFVPLSKEFSGPVKYSKYEELTRKPHISELEQHRFPYDLFIDKRHLLCCSNCKTQGKLKKSDDAPILYRHDNQWYCQLCLHQLGLATTFETFTQKENTGVHKCPLCKKIKDDSKFTIITSEFGADNKPLYVCDTCQLPRDTSTSSTQKIEKE